ncbi:MAG: hypothetical protein VW397_01160 [Candidatus Margulisiibacteriota bacterium]
MIETNIHDFHIPVMGTAFTIDTPYKVARFGISSVVSIGDDELCETMRKYYSEKYAVPFNPIIKSGNVDYRAQRITAYLDLLDDLINQQISIMKTEPFNSNSENSKYFLMLPEKHPMKAIYSKMMNSIGAEREMLEQQCRDFIQPGAIDVNIMTKLDRTNLDDKNQPLPDEYSDAVSALRGFSNSKIDAGIVFSAGFNRRLFAHCENVSDFYLSGNGKFKKRLILKVSDYRSSLIQGRFLAKKGIWVSEYRVESGLNCGGHAFATDGLLCGPILEEFKQNKSALDAECRDLCNQVLANKQLNLIPDSLESIVTYQGGIGTSNEQQFLMNYYNCASTGWATPFLLVPEVTTLDEATRLLLQNASKDDCYLSGVSPLGVPFNTVKNTPSEEQKLERVKNGRPGSPCPKGHLIFDTEFTKRPICKASVLYQKRKIEQLKKLDLISDEYQAEFNRIIDKACLCEDLAAPALIEYGITNDRPLKSTVCAGPNIAYYSKIVSLKEMIDHIYGRINLISDSKRPSFFVAELNMYIKYLNEEVQKLSTKISQIEIKRLSKFAENLGKGIGYYINLTREKYIESDSYKAAMLSDFNSARQKLDELIENNQTIFSSVLRQSFASA